MLPLPYACRISFLWSTMRGTFRIMGECIAVASTSASCVSRSDYCHWRTVDIIDFEYPRAWPNSCEVAPSWIKSFVMDVYERLMVSSDRIRLFCTLTQTFNLNYFSERSSLTPNIRKSFLQQRIVTQISGSLFWLKTIL